MGCGAKPEPPIEAPKPPPVVQEPEPEADVSATIDVLAGSPTEILLDGKPIGTTPITAYKVSPGQHDVTFVDPARGNRTMGVTVEPGDSKIVQSDPAPAANEAMKPEPAKKK